MADAEWQMQIVEPELQFRRIGEAPGNHGVRRD
jgi:hypothetical protein